MELELTDLKEIVDGKRVVVLGSSKCVEDNNRENIEGYDVVVRVNYGWPVDKILLDKTGNRVDIFYNYGHNRKRNNNLTQAKLVSYAIEGPFSEFCKRKNIHTTSLVANRRQFREKYDVYPTTGFFAIWELLHCNLKELYVTGFTFYKEPYFEDRPRKDIVFEKILDGQTVHDFNWEFEHMCRLYLDDSRVKIDNKLYELMVADAISKIKRPSKKIARALNIMKFPLPEGESEWTYTLVNKYESNNTSKN